MRRHNFHRRGTVLLAAIAVTLSGCSSLPPATSVPQSDSGATSATDEHPALPPAGSGRGGYYLDDGPGDKTPDGLADLPDATPRVEPYSRRGNKPYVVFGKTYTPFTDQRPFKQRGRGSWYGKKFHGQTTSSGERYDMYQMTAAHPTLPIPSYARVTNIRNGKQVIVRVNDRGPFLHGRVIDLSYTAALKLGYIAQGSAELEVERLLPDDIARMTADKTQLAAGTDSSARNSPASAGAPVATLQSTDMAAVAGYYLQLGAYSQQANADAARARMTQEWKAGLPAPQVQRSGSLYRIYSGPFDSRSQADAAADQLESGTSLRSVVVQR